LREPELLRLENVTKVFTTGWLVARKRIVAVDNVSMSIPSGKPIIYTIAGESGSGKSTLARMVLGILRPDSGRILYRGKDINRMTKSEWRLYRREVQAIFQDPYGTFNPIYTVDHVLRQPIRKFKLASSRDEEDALIGYALEAVGLRKDEVLNKYPYQLSGGQRQRIMLARALLLKPRLVVADEPVSMLDASLRATILNYILELKEKYNIYFIYITHDLSTADYISDYIAIMYRGSIVEAGLAKDIIREPLHPYTQLLMESIPIPDPSSRKRRSIDIWYREEVETNVRGCKFYSRCPFRMDICKTIPPKLLYSRNRHVACHLYKES